MKDVVVAVLLAVAAAALLYLFLHAESEIAVGAVVLAAGGGIIAATRTRAAAQVVGRGRMVSARLRNGLAIAGVAAVALAFYENDFALFLMARALIVFIACLGLTVQFGYAGVVNFAGASFFGVGAYTAAVLARASPVPHLFSLVLGGAAAALVGSLLILPLLRTRGHYAALITIAFVLLFRTFLEVNDALGGPQGLKLPGFNLLGWDFNDSVEVGSWVGSSFLNYVALALALAALAFVLVRRLERSWIGLSLDAVRLDETAASCFGLNVARWKIAGFTIGNFIIGVAGAFSAHMVGFIAPNNFTFGESLVFVSILLLGGLGNPWGVALATAIVVLLPEKLQLIQEYRYLLYAGLVILILLFRPAGLLPRPLRRWFAEPA
jgi:ABC-type branched-subunit amino acid transport system permease subunit